MLVASLIFSMLAVEPAPAKSWLKTCPDGSVIRQDERCIVFDHRDQFSWTPQMDIRTIEWQCGRRTARVQIRIVDLAYAKRITEPVPLPRFQVELLDLHLNGAPPSSDSVARVRAALAPLDSVGLFYGRCFTNAFELNIVGHNRSDPPREQRRARIELK